MLMTRTHDEQSYSPTLKSGKDQRALLHVLGVKANDNGCYIPLEIKNFVEDMPFVKRPLRSIGVAGCILLAFNLKAAANNG